MQEVELKGEHPKIHVSSLQVAVYRPRARSWVSQVRPARRFLLQPRPCALCPAPIRLLTPQPSAPTGISLCASSGRGRGHGRFHTGRLAGGQPPAQGHRSGSRTEGRRFQGHRTTLATPPPRGGGRNCSCLRRLYCVPICPFWKEGGWGWEWKEGNRRRRLTSTCMLFRSRDKAPRSGLERARFS